MLCNRKSQSSIFPATKRLFLIILPWQPYLYKIRRKLNRLLSFLRCSQPMGVILAHLIEDLYLFVALKPFFPLIKLPCSWFSWQISSGPFTFEFVNVLNGRILFVYYTANFSQRITSKTRVRKSRYSGEILLSPIHCCDLTKPRYLLSGEVCTSPLHSNRFFVYTVCCRRGGQCFSVLRTRPQLTRKVTEHVILTQWEKFRHRAVTQCATFAHPWAIQTIIIINIGIILVKAQSLYCHPGSNLKLLKYVIVCLASKENLLAFIFKRSARDQAEVQKK